MGQGLAVRLPQAYTDPEDKRMPLELHRARQIARRVRVNEWDILELAAEVPWLEAWLRDAPLEEVAAWVRETMANGLATPER